MCGGSLLFMLRPFACELQERLGRGLMHVVDPGRRRGGLLLLVVCPCLHCPHLQILVLWAALPPEVIA